MDEQREKRLGVFLGDVVSSRQIQDRDAFRGKVQGACAKINAQFSSQLFADFKILKGLDEIGGVLTGIEPLYKIVTLISGQLQPVAMKFTFVRDCVDTALKTHDTALMDGPAFHIASSEITKLKSSNLMFYIKCQDEIIDSSIGGEINLILLIKKHWSAKQHEIVRLYEQVKSQKEVARLLQITQQSVSQTLKSVMWKEIYGIEQGINKNLELYERSLTK